MKARITINLKTDVLDPEGNAIAVALGHAGFSGIDSLRKGKIINIELAETDADKARATLKNMCEQLLCNLVIEDYRIELLDSD